MSLKGRMKPSVEFSSSSIADIVFLLLIFFLLTSSFVNQVGVKVELPKSDSDNSDPASNSVTITESGAYYWNNDEIGADKTKEEKEALVIDKITETLDVPVEDAENLTDEQIAEQKAKRTVRLRTDQKVMIGDAAFVFSTVAKYGGTVDIQTTQK